MIEPLSHKRQPTGTQLLRVERIYDFDEISKIYQDPYIQTVSHDFRKAEPIQHPDVYYFGAYINNEICGLFVMIDDNYIDVSVHSLLLQKAVHQSRNLMCKFLDVVFSSEGIVRVTAQINENLKSALNSVLKLGFKYEGFKESAVQINNKNMGIHILGMTREKWVNK